MPFVNVDAANGPASILIHRQDSCPRRRHHHPYHHHHRVACPVMDVAIATSVLHLCAVEDLLTEIT